MIDFDQNPGAGGVSVMAAVDHHGPRGRFRSRLQNKGGLLQPPSPNANDYIASSSPRSVYGIGELNRRITDLKVDNPALSPPQTFTRDTSPKLLELGQNYSNINCHYQPTMMQYNQQINQQIRRDSNNSTTSSSYYSMKSCDVSRRSSQQSHTSSMSTLRPNYVNYDPQSFYDPISAGSSRRSSQLSTNEGGNYGPPSSQLLSSHLARLQRHSAVPSNHPYHSGYPYQQNQYYAYQQQQAAAGNYGNFYNYNHQNQPQMVNLTQTPTSSTDRRMSEPISNSSRTAATNQSIPRRPRSTTPTKSLETVLNPAKDKEKTESEASSPSKPHPNETVVLDVLKTNEKIENCDELVFPDEMVMYLNQVGDETTEMSTGSVKIKLDLDNELEPMSSSISIDKIKEEDLFELLAEVEVKPDTGDDDTSNDQEINNNGELKTESDIGGGKSRQILCKS